VPLWIYASETSSLNVGRATVDGGSVSNEHWYHCADGRFPFSRGFILDEI
jgi:hypothetical protein